MASGRPFQKGQSGNPSGRPKGAVNKTTAAEREYAQSVLSSPKYLAGLKKRAESGKLAPAVECMLWDRAYGKVKEQHEHTGEDGGPITVVFGGRHRPRSEGEDHG